MELPQIEIRRSGGHAIGHRILDAHKIFWRASWRGRGAFHIRGLKTVAQEKTACNCARRMETLWRECCGANQHIGAVQRASYHANFLIAVIWILQVDSQIVRISPGCKLWPIRKVGCSLSVGSENGVQRKGVGEPLQVG